MEASDKLRLLAHQRGLVQSEETTTQIIEEQFGSKIMLDCELCGQKVEFENYEFHLERVCMQRELKCSKCNVSFPCMIYTEHRQACRADVIEEMKQNEKKEYAQNIQNMLNMNPSHSNFSQSYVDQSISDQPHFDMYDRIGQMHSNSNVPSVSCDDTIEQHMPEYQVDDQSFNQSSSNQNIPDEYPINHGPVANGNQGSSLVYSDVEIDPTRLSTVLEEDPTSISAIQSSAASQIKNVNQASSMVYSDVSLQAIQSSVGQGSLNLEYQQQIQRRQAELVVPSQVVQCPQCNQDIDHHEFHDHQLAHQYEDEQNEQIAQSSRFDQIGEPQQAERPQENSIQIRLSQRQQVQPGGSIFEQNQAMQQNRQFMVGPDGGFHEVDVNNNVAGFSNLSINGVPNLQQNSSLQNLQNQINQFIGGFEHIQNIHDQDDEENFDNIEEEAFNFEQPNHHDHAQATQILAQLPITNFKKDNFKNCGDENKDKLECMICMATFQENDKIRLLQCLHQYHQVCIDKWFEGSMKCPLCNYVQKINV